MEVVTTREVVRLTIDHGDEPIQGTAPAAEEAGVEAGEQKRQRRKGTSGPKPMFPDRVRTTISVTVSPQTLAWLKKSAEEERRSLTFLVSEMLENAYAQHLLAGMPQDVE